MNIKDKIELNNDELNNASGGVNPNMKYTLNSGDCFLITVNNIKVYRIIVLDDYNRVPGNTLIEVRMQKLSLSGEIIKDYTTSIPAFHDYLDKYTYYVGNNVF